MKYEVKRVPLIPGLSLRTRALIKLFEDKGSVPGTRVSDAEMEEAVGFGVRSGQPGYGYFRTAQKRMLADHGRWWAWVPHEPYCELCSEKGKLSAADGDTRAARRKATRGLRKLETIDLKQLPEPDRPLVIARVVQTATLISIASPSIARRIAEKSKVRLREPKQIEGKVLVEAMSG